MGITKISEIYLTLELHQTTKKCSWKQQAATCAVITKINEYKIFGEKILTGNKKRPHGQRLIPLAIHQFSCRASSTFSNFQISLQARPSGDIWVE
jgi:hypothetical protein